MQIINIKIVLIALLALIANQTFGQLVINEGSNKNYSTISDEDGDFEDWIEIYNSSSTAIDLFNYSLSDNSNPGEWAFPHQIVQPGQYIIVFCSGKDRFASSSFTLSLTISVIPPYLSAAITYFSFIPNISLPDPGREPLNESPKFISIFCEKDEVDDFISRGFLLVYSIKS